MLTDDKIQELVRTGEVALDASGDTVMRFEVLSDYSVAMPWVSCDGYGVISSWEMRDKRACERILVSDRGRAHMFYDVQASMAKARKEGWGLPEEEARGLTKKQIIARAVEKDFQNCQKWAEGDIWWQCLKLAIYCDDMELSDCTQYLGGVSSDTEESDLCQMAGDMAHEALQYAKKSALDRISLLEDIAQNGIG